MSFPISEYLNKAIQTAQQVALKYGNSEIGTEHILYGILSAEGSASSTILRGLGAKLKDFDEIFAESSNQMLTIGGADFTPRVKQTLKTASMMSQSYGGNFVGTEHLLYCILQDPNSLAYQILSNLYKIDIYNLCNKLKATFDNSGSTGSVEPSATAIPAQLVDLGIDMTQRARDHKIDPIIGRQDEIERIIQILCRKTKNNPVLIGEPGVGKSAVVEGLSKQIVDGNVPELLKNKIIFSLDIGSLMAGTKYRGSLEEKLKDAINVIKEQSNIIVFIDELHTLAQAGSKEGEVSPADILKPYLARGEMQTIGATTTDEYRKFIEKDKALERRFQPIMVAPPSVEDTIEILRGLQDNYEAFHKVKITDEALVAAAKMSDRYIMDRFLPDKAIDLIDEAMSKAKVNGNTTPSPIKGIEEEIKHSEQLKQEAIHHEDYKKAAEMRDKIAELTKKIESMKMDWSKNAEREGKSIGVEEIADVVSSWTKIPVKKLTESETQRLVGLEEILHKRVIGQDEAVTSVAKAIRRARAGLKDPNRPVGTFLFLGPTGVGKTELTKAISEAMFDDENAVIRLDMSEYMEAHSVSKLVGAPPGYVGFDDGGQLTEQVRRKPYCVVLFDEIEKAHPDVYNMLLQMLDDGRLTDAQGRVVSFKNAIIIMTSNVGASDLNNSHRNLGFSSSVNKAEDNEKKTKEIINEALRSRFKPEFLNRIDVISYFRHLTIEDIRKIAVIMLNRVEKSLLERNIKLAVTENALEYIIKTGYNPEYGARPLRRVIEQTIEDNIAEGLLDGKVKDNSTVQVDITPDGIVSLSTL